MTGLTLPALTTAQMVEVDRLMVNDYGIALVQMMENAGRNLAELTRRLMGGGVQGKSITVLAGTGGNGGGGLAAARHLSNWGAHVRAILAQPAERLKDVPAQQWRALERLPVRREVYAAAAPPDLSTADAVLDAMIGYSLKGNPRGTAANLIRLVNEAGGLVIALDTPSGLDATAGLPGRPCITATATLTLALPKVGLLTPQAQPFVGDLYLADIGVPPELYAEPTLGLEVGPIFEAHSILRLTPEGWRAGA